MSLLQPLLLLLSASFLRMPVPAGAACSPKRCGDLNITYPFWLEEGGGRPPCGSPVLRAQLRRRPGVLQPLHARAIPGHPGLRGELLPRRREP
uniref:Wall-associated receptor kinase galacturonan-binding domain-containing protein n=1 Tax=Aegilops tauschii subsp. strangulata TaxID=200361 RepID=A0A453J0K2_AEGTS